MRLRIARLSAALLKVCRTRMLSVSGRSRREQEKEWPEGGIRGKNREMWRTCRPQREKWDRAGERDDEDREATIGLARDRSRGRRWQASLMLRFAQQEGPFARRFEEGEGLPVPRSSAAQASLTSGVSGERSESTARRG